MNHFDVAKVRPILISSELFAEKLCSYCINLLTLQSRLPIMYSEACRAIKQTNNNHYEEDYYFNYVGIAASGSQCL